MKVSVFGRQTMEAALALQKSTNVLYSPRAYQAFEAMGVKDTILEQSIPINGVLTMARGKQVYSQFGKDP
jgi:2-polyprenyl-6-methoxyphenol hydroxylase-like FAD-dependent oxidoreductase